MPAWATWFGTVLAVLLWATWSPAWEIAGTARLLTNDFLGDGHDRWRTASWQAGVLAVPAPGQGGPDMIELRFGAQILAPASLANPDPEDRPLAGVLSLGVHGYWMGPAAAFHAGLDLVGTGPSTGLDNLLTSLHPNDQDPSDAVLDAQIGDAVYPTAQVSVSRLVLLSPGVRVYPFAQGMAGAETLVRIGADLIVGPAGEGALPVRDEVTGFLLPSTALRAQGFALTIGGDAAQVADSVYLPDRPGLGINNPRLRARGGLLWRGQKAQAFYGVAWLGEEFDGQPEGQVVGSIHLNYRF